MVGGGGGVLGTATCKAVTAVAPEVLLPALREAVAGHDRRRATSPDAARDLVREGVVQDRQPLPAVSPDKVRGHDPRVRPGQDDAVVTQAVILVDRQEGGKEAVAQEVPEVEAVFTISDLQ